MVKPLITDTFLSTVAEAIARKDRFVVLAHEKPDGDAIGSSLGLSNWLRENQLQADVILPTPCPQNFKWMPGMQHLHIYETEPQTCQQLLQQAHLLFFLDMNALSRTGATLKTILPSYLENKASLLLDHHENQQNFTRQSHAQPGASSTCELVYRLISQLSGQETLSPQVSTCLLSGIMTDTGCFAYSSSHPELYETVAALLRSGIEKNDIYQAIFRNQSVDSVKMSAYVLGQKMQLFPQYKAAVMSINAQEIARYRIEPGDFEGLVNKPLEMRGVTLSVFLREEDTVRISFRSLGNFNVDRMASELFGGGGHFNAAGARYSGPFDEAVRRVTDAIPHYCQNISK